MSCCVQGCKSKRGRNDKRSFFTVGANGMFNSWYDILSSKSIKITKNSKICELHFKPEDVVREEAFVQTDGTVILVERGKAKLRKGAVPSILPTIKPVVPYWQLIEPMQKQIPPMSDAINRTLQIEEVTCFVPKIVKTKFSIEDMNVARNIKVPTKQWLENITDSFAMWTCWANDFSHILRRVIVRVNLKLQVFIGDKEISFGTKMINDIREIEQIMVTLNNIFPNEKVNDKDRISECPDFVMREQYKLKDNMRCLHCSERTELYPLILVQGAVLGANRNRNVLAFQRVAVADTV